MRPIILLTLPHTGTHTLLYLLNVLGGAETYHSHVTRVDKPQLVYLFNHDLSDTIIIYTHRDVDRHLESWKARYGEKNKDIDYNYEAHDWVMRRLDGKANARTFHLNIDEPKHHRHTVIGMACLEAGIEYTPTMHAFVELWPKMNARSGEEVALTEDEADALSRAKRSRIGDYLLKHHNFSLKEKRYVA